MNMQIKIKKHINNFKKEFYALMALAIFLTAMPFSGETVYADTPTPLTFTALESNSSVTFDYSYCSNIEYKLNDDEWTSYTKGEKKILLSVGDNISFRGQNIIAGGKHFTMQGKISASGDVTSLINGVGGNTVLKTSNCFNGMFSGCDSLVTAPNLPSTTLSSDCYIYMFRGCTGLTTAPRLPATSLTDRCYMNMFEGCTGLTTAPRLPATSLADSCYMNMFRDCTNLTTAPNLPAIFLADKCYLSMFEGCTSLAATPALPATSLAELCYTNMFYNCTSLTTIPDLPATSLAGHCYLNMFEHCRNLEIVDSYDDTHQIPWAIPTEAQTADYWNSGTFSFCGPKVCIDSTNLLEIGRTYYLLGIGVNSLTLDKENLVLEKNQTANISATVTPSNATYKDLTWISSNANVATVNSQGLVTAIAPGTATITVITERNEKTAVCNVTVKEHSHTYSDVWSKDADFHWHQAICEHTSEVSDKAPHTWDEGRIATEATVSAEGVKTYTCTVCGQTKTEAIPKLVEPSAGESAGGTGDSAGGTEGSTSGAGDSAGGASGGTGDSASGAGDSLGGAGDSAGNAGDSADAASAVTPAQKKKNTFTINAGLKVNQKGSKIKVSWGKVSMADGYTVSVAYCNTKLGKNKKNDIDIKGAKKTSTKITKVDGKKINLKENFKVVVKAYKYVGSKKQVIGTSIIAHVVGAKNKTYTNAKAIKLNKSKYTLKAGKKAKIKAKTILVDKTKKQLSDEHAKEFRYKSTNTKVAKVSSNGVITAVKKGTCTIYVYSRNGYAKKVTVKVK